MTHNRKHTIQMLCAVIVIALGAALIIAGFIVPPLGVIDSSVLVGYGETLTFAGALVGVDYHYRVKNDINRDRDENN